MSTLLNDLKCRLLRRMVYAKAYPGHKPNSFEPWNEPGEKTLENGLVCKSDLRYGEKYPNSFFDVW